MDLDIVGGSGEVLEVDFMLNEMWNSEEQAFWRKLGEARVVGADWFEVMAFGTRLWQEVSKQPRCELSGASLEQEAVAEAMKLELEEMTRLRVGRVVSTEVAKEIEKSSGNRIMATRWVVSLKGDGRTRCRLVCEDFRSGGLSSFREELYLPTASLESLRSVLAVAQSKRMGLLSMDVSVAFMHARLPSGYKQVVKFPPFCGE